jgi:O-antigen ligase
MNTPRTQSLVVLGMLALIGLALLVPTTKVGLAVTLVVALVALFQPKAGLIALFGYFPVRPVLQELNPALKLAGDLIVLAVFARVIWDNRTNIKSLFQFKIFEIAFFCFLAIGALSAYFVTNIGISAIVFELRAFLIMYLVYYSLRRISVTKQDILQVVWLTFAFGILLAVQAIIEKLSLRTMFMPDHWVYRQLSTNNFQRVYGLLNNPNILALYLSFVFMLTMYGYKSLVSRVAKVLVWIGLTLMMGVWILTLSRGAWIALLIASVVYVLFTRRWKVVAAAALVIAIGYSVVTVPVTKATTYYKTHNYFTEKKTVNNTVQKRKQKVTIHRVKEVIEKSTYEKSLESGRLYVINKGFAIWKDHPVTGTGFATFGDSATKSYPSPIYKTYQLPTGLFTDNQYIQVLVETGAVGALFFGIFLLGLLYQSFRLRKVHPFAIPGLAVIVAALWCGLLYNIWEDKTISLFLFAILGIVMSKKDTKSIV